MAYAIRGFRTEDASDLAALTLAAIRGVGSHRYSREQVEAWASRHPSGARLIARDAAGSDIFVSVDSQDNLVAYALLEPDGHLDMLYCHPNHTRKGLAADLLAVAESRARSVGMVRLYTEASELARSAFEHAGYVTKHRRDFTIEHDGKAVPIHNFAMEKLLV